MKQFLLALIILVGGFGLTIGSQLDKNESKGISLQVKIEKAKMLASGERIKWEITLENLGPSMLRVSKFSLQSLLFAGRFKTADGQKWQVKPIKQLLDPPPVDIDYTLRLPSKGMARIEMETNALELIGSSPDKPAAFPSKIQYEFDRQVAVIENTTRKPYRVRCHGSGDVAIENIDPQ